MDEHAAQPRPAQVTYAAWAVILGSLAMLVSAFERISALHSLDTRKTIEQMVADQPSMLNLTVTDWLEVFKVLGMVSAACSVAAVILGWQVMQRSRSARVALSVLGAPLTIAGLAINPLFALMVAFGVVVSWLPVANAWFDPRRHARVQPMSDTPPPPPPGAPGAPGQQRPYGQQPPYGQYGPGQPGQPGQQPYAAPQYPYAPPAPYGRGPMAPDARPRPVTAAAVITFVLAGITAVLGLVVAIVGASAAQDTIDELSKRGYDTSGFTAHELATGFVVFGSFLAVVGIAAILAAVFVLRRSRGARIVLTVLSAITIALSLVGIASVLSLITLVGAIVTVVLLFRRSSNAWFARRPQQPPYPPSYPPTYPPNHPGSPWTGA